MDGWMDGVGVGGCWGRYLIDDEWGGGTIYVDM